MHSRSIGASLLVLICAWGCNGGGATDAAEEPITNGPLDFAAFDDVLENFVKDQGLEGAAAIVLQREKGAVHEAAYGEFTKDRVFLLASTSKILSAGVVMHLADQGVVDLDAPIGTYVPDWGDAKADLTLAQLLSNSAGMLGVTEDSQYAPYLCQFLAGRSLQECAKSIYVADDAATRVAPDTVYRYGGAQWQLAGGIAEAASMKSWPELVAELYGPCGAESIGFANQYTQAYISAGSGDAWAYPSFFKGDVSILLDTDNPNIEGGGYGTVGDYGDILLMHLRGGLCGETRVLSQAMVERMQQDRVGEKYGAKLDLHELDGYGFGWFVDREQPGLVVDPGAYGAMAWIDNERGYAAFIALESTTDIGHIVRREAAAVLAEMFEP